MFFYTSLEFTRSQSYPLDNKGGFYRLIAASYKSERLINFIGFEKVHLKADCIPGTIVNGVGQAILYKFAIDQPPGYKFFKKSKVKLFEKINKAVLSHITFYLEEDDYKAVNFNGETISFTCQLIKI